MKTILIFIGLKLAEVLGIAGLIIGIYYLGVLAAPITWQKVMLSTRIPKNELEFFFCGIITICITFLAVMAFLCVSILLLEVIKANWDYAKELSKRKKE